MSSDLASPRRRRLQSSSPSSTTSGRTPSFAPRPRALGFVATWALLATVASSGVAACSDSDSANAPPASTPASSTGVFGTVRGPSGAPVAGAKVTVNGATTTTDAAGTFKLKTKTGEAVVSVQAKGFADGFVRVIVADGAPTAAHLRILTMEGPFVVDAAAGGTATGSRGAKVVVPSGGLVDTNGRAITGNVDVFVTPVDPSDPIAGEGAPELLAQSATSGTRVGLTSFGMLDVTIEQGGQRLQVAPGKTLAISIPVPAGPTEAPPTMPLWSYDTAKGVWIAEGTLALNAQAGVYEGAIPHLSWWNADIEDETGCVCGSVVDKSGKPVGGAIIRTSGVGYLGTSSTSSAADGSFCVAARVNSPVRVTATHAEGGGQIREVASGTTVVPLPVADGSKCGPGGVWTVEPGVVVFPDGSSRSCQQTLTTIESCVGSAFVSLYDCFDPAGACKTEGSSFLDGTTTYANGAKSVLRIDTTTGTVTNEFFASDGRKCGTQITKGATTGTATTTVTTPAGSSSYDVVSTGDGDATVTCTDGSKRTLTGAEMASLESCGGDGEACEDTTGSGGGGLGITCSQSPCNGDDVCCGGVICTTRASCDFGISCDTDAQCEGDQICCINGALKSERICRTKSACASFKGGCKADAECDAGSICCDGSCAKDRTFCGECGTSADCPGASSDPKDVYCCASGGNAAYCTTSAEACFSGQTCKADADCGASGLVCCDRGDGGSPSCESTKSCFAGRSCKNSDACGGLFCCDEPTLGTFETCQVRAECNFGLACTNDTPCNTGTCCSGGQLDGACAPSPAFCVQGQACTSNADCGNIPNVTCCAPAGNICLEGCLF